MTPTQRCGRGYGGTTITLGATDTSKEEAERAHVERCRVAAHAVRQRMGGDRVAAECGGQGGCARGADLRAQEEVRYGASASVLVRSRWSARRSWRTAPTNRRRTFFLADAAQRRHLVPALLEPSGLSDNAGLHHRAEARRRQWVVNGQSVGVRLPVQRLRHAVNALIPTYRSIRASRISCSTCRRPESACGRSSRSPATHFNEVFLTDVRVPPENILGPCAAAGRVAHTTLANERNMIGSSGTGITFSAILRLARECDATSDPVLRQQLAGSATALRDQKWLGLRGAGAPPRRSGARRARSPSCSSRNVAARRRPRARARSEGNARNRRTPQNPGCGSGVPQPVGDRTGGGTRQIQRNVIGERVLGLPGDIRLDKSVPFRELRVTKSRRRPLPVGYSLRRAGAPASY